MSEKKLQAEIVISFSQQRPEEKGNLWSTRNTTFSERDGQTQKAMGMIAGVSDLIYYRGGRFVGIEIKKRGSSHNSKHVYQQVKWGELIEDAGGEWYIVRSLDEFWEVINGGSTDMDTKTVRALLDFSGTKIKF